MSYKLSFERLAQYNQWMNGNIYRACEQLNADELSKDRGAFFDSIIGTLNHIMVGDIIWFKRFLSLPATFKSLEYIQAIEMPAALDTMIYPDLVPLREMREKIDACILQFTSELSEDILSTSLQHQNMKGDQFTRNFGHLLQHVFNHQTHHRGQVSTLFSQCGIDIGTTDMLLLIPNETAAS